MTKEQTIKDLKEELALSTALYKRTIDKQEGLIKDLEVEVESVDKLVEENAALAESLRVRDEALGSAHLAFIGTGRTDMRETIRHAIHHTPNGKEVLNRIRAEVWKDIVVEADCRYEHGGDLRGFLIYLRAKAREAEG